MGPLTKKRNMAPFSLKKQFPEGGGCSWCAADDAAEPLVRMLADCTRLVPCSERLDSGCIVRGFTGKVPENSFAIIRQGLRVALDDRGRADVISAPWEATNTQLRGFMVRQLFFIGVLPALLRGNAFLVHGVLAERRGEGILISGPSGIGKSTTAARLNSDFTVLCDDCMLLFRCGDGRWIASPVPTWSRWILGKPAFPVDSNKQIELKAFYLLERGEHGVFDFLPGEALPGVAPSFTDMVRWHTGSYPGDVAKKLLNNALSGAMALAGSLPGKRFRVKLDETKVGDLL